MLKKILSWALVAFLVWWVATDPRGAANVGHGLMTAAGHLASSLSAFASGLAPAGGAR